MTTIDAIDPAREVLNQAPPLQPLNLFEADAALQEHRGCPTLLELADRVCHATFDPGSFQASVQAAYAETGLPYQYLRERETRYG